LHTALTPNPDDMYRAQMRALQLPRYVGKDPDHYHPTTHDWGPIVIPPQHYWVMGDNRDESTTAVSGGSCRATTSGESAVHLYERGFSAVPHSLEQAVSPPH